MVIEENRLMSDIETADGLDRWTGSIEVQMDDGTSFDFPLESDEVSIGRAEDCDLVLQSAAISRKHAQVVLTDDGFVITDLGSLNGVIIDQAKIQTYILSDNDIVTLGGCKLVFHLTAPPVVLEKTVVRKIAPADEGPTGQKQPSEKLPRLKRKKGFKFNNKLSRKQGKTKRLAAAAVITLVVTAAGIYWVAQYGRNVASSPEQQSGETSTQIRETISPTQASGDAPQLQQPANTIEVTPQKAEQARQHFEQGQIQYDAGRLSQAASEWGQAVKLDPTNELAKMKYDSSPKRASGKGGCGVQTRNEQHRLS